MIENKIIQGKQRTYVEFNKDIFISTFDNKRGLDVLVTLTDNTDQFKEEGKLDLDKDYNTSKMTFESLDPQVMLKFTDPKSIRNMIVILQDAEKLLNSKLPKRKSTKG